MPLMNKDSLNPSRGIDDVELEVGLTKSPQTKGADKWNLNESKLNKPMLRYWGCIGAEC